MNTTVYKLVLRMQVTPARLLVLSGLVAVAILLGVINRFSDDVDRAETAVEFLGFYGINIFAAIAALALAASTLGNLVEDRTLVYLWLRPVSRLGIASACFAATISVLVPVVAVSMLVAALIAGVDDLVWSLPVATALATFAYSGLFCAAGLRLKRSLLWGLAFISVWEITISSSTEALARFHLRSYPLSIISEATGTELIGTDRHLVAAYVVPLVVGLVSVAYTARRLQRMDVD